VTHASGPKDVKVTGAKEYRRRATCGRTVVRIPLIALDDLIETKRTGRLEDAADIEVLEEIKRLRG